MNFDMIAAIAAVAAAVALIVFLPMLLQQMREAARQRRLAAYHSVMDAVDTSSGLIAHDHTSADIWWRASKGVEHLTDAERVRYFAMLFILFRSWERAFHYDSEGALEHWSAEAVMKPMIDFAMSNGVQEYWALRKRWYMAEFRDWVDNQIRDRSGVDLYGDEFRIFGSAEAEDTP